jgi:hypothetical protein
LAAVCPVEAFSELATTAADSAAFVLIGPEPVGVLVGVLVAPGAGEVPEVYWRTSHLLSERLEHALGLWHICESYGAYA